MSTERAELRYATFQRVRAVCKARVCDEDIFFLIDNAGPITDALEPMLNEPELPLRSCEVLRAPAAPTKGNVNGQP